MSARAHAAGSSFRTHRMQCGLLLALLSALVACSSRSDPVPKDRLFSATDARTAPVQFDWSKPEAALFLGADDAAARLGAFEWSADVTWTVSGGKDPARRVHVVERHRVREMANGEFEAEAEVDPGLGKGSETGKHVVFVKGMTYARSRYAPFGAFRERPSDRGRDARRYRDESFGMVADLAALYGPGLRLAPAGQGTYLSRPVRRFTLSLASSVSPSPAPSPPRYPDGGPDEPTRRRLAFLEGRVPMSVEGEVLSDAETGVPMKVQLRGVFQVKDDPAARAEVEFGSEVTAIGSRVPAVVRPANALADERKPRGIARALEAAGLRKRGEAQTGREEPEADEGE